MLLTSISLAVAAIPEALPTIIIITLALAARRMFRNHALMQNLSAVETLGAVLADTAFAENLKRAVLKIKVSSEHAEQLSSQLAGLAQLLHLDLTHKQGALQVLLRDTVTAENLRKTLKNIQQGSDGFNQNMEALKHNFLFRRYFKNKETSNKKTKF